MSNRHLSAHLDGEQKVFGRSILAPFGNADRKYPLSQTVGIISLLIFHPLVLTSIGFLITIQVKTKISTAGPRMKRMPNHSLQNLQSTTGISF